MDFEKDIGFMEWLDSVNPDWELEYIGNIESMYEAYLAGYNRCLIENNS
jgi:hypothetical protein